ncbi:MAG: DinB family protein [Schleiferiaceae bacterium]
MKVNAFIVSRLEELASYKKQFENVFYFLEEEELFFIPKDEKWSAIECVEHINNLNEVYLPQLTEVCKKKNASQKELIELSWWQKRLRNMMSPLDHPKSKKIRTRTKLQPRRIQNPDHKISAQKVMENFISDLSQLEKIIRIIPESPELRNTRVMSAAPPIKFKSITALEMLIPHIGRHLSQAERILSGGNVEKQAKLKNEDLIFPGRDS